MELLPEMEFKLSSMMRRERICIKPAVNVVGTNSVNAVMETAAEVNSPVMIQFSNGGGIFFAGKSLSNEGQKAAIAGSVSGAMHVTCFG